MIVSRTAVFGAVFTVVTVAILLGALIAGEVAPGNKLVRRSLTVGGLVSTLLCLSLVVVRFVSVL